MEQKEKIKQQLTMVIEAIVKLLRQPKVQLMLCGGVAGFSLLQLVAVAMTWTMVLLASGLVGFVVFRKMKKQQAEQEAEQVE